MRSFFLPFFSFFFFFSFLYGTNEQQKKKGLISDLITLKHHFEIAYAPLEWKKEYSGWDLDEAFQKAKEETLAIPQIKIKQFHQIIRRMCNSMHDCHVKVIFLSNERAILPFSVNEVEGRYFIDWIDPFKMPSSYYGILVGDELLEFGGRAPGEEIEKLQQLTGKKYTNPRTETAIAAKNLTIRLGALGDDVPKGSIIIKTLSHQSGKISSYQLLWDYKKDRVRNNLDLLQSIPFLPHFFSSSRSVEQNDSWLHEKLMMIHPFYDLFTTELKDQRVLGNRESFVPKLGKTVWVNGEETEDSFEESLNESHLEDRDDKKSDLKHDHSTLTNRWNAYIYKHKNGKKIGYIRIPHYKGDEDDLLSFALIIERMDRETDALVLDQVNNPGGELFYLYGLASMLTTKPLATPRHRFKINHRDAIEAYFTIERINNEFQDMEEKEEEKGEKEEESANHHQKLLFLKLFAEFILDEWNLGRSLTHPIHVFGVDMVNPYCKHVYSKPILMLINELDFSGGDFLPAILQDNGRATMFGSRTAGAGGCVGMLNFQNNSGIAFVTNTFSIAERQNSDKIEDLGVVPDIEYEIFADDVISGYMHYADAVNKAVDELVGNPISEECEFEDDNEQKFEPILEQESELEPQFEPELEPELE